jgi:hypothetical protein
MIFHAPVKETAMRTMRSVTLAALAVGLTAGLGLLTATAAAAITPGAFCAKSAAGSIGYSADGDAYVCRSDGTRYRWRPVNGGALPAPDPTLAVPLPNLPPPALPPVPVSPTPTATPTPATTTSPAADTRCPSTITFNATPEPVTRGGTVTLQGVAGCRTHSNAATVRLYFRKQGSQRFLLAGTATATSSGRFHQRLTQRETGTWQARYLGNPWRRPVQSPLDRVQVKG